jgi:hemerythrin-like domain-containing protein
MNTKKTVGRDTTLEYLRVIVDTANMEARLPQNKVDQIISFIGTFLSK